MSWLDSVEEERRQRQEAKLHEFSEQRRLEEEDKRRRVEFVDRFDLFIRSCLSDMATRTWEGNVHTQFRPWEDGSYLIWSIRKIINSQYSESFVVKLTHAKDDRPAILSAGAKPPLGVLNWAGFYREIDDISESTIADLLRAYYVHGPTAEWHGR